MRYILMLLLVSPLESKEITLTIHPKVALATEFKRATIRVEWRIPRHPDNRLWAFSYEADNGDSGSSQGQMDGGNSYVVYPICTKENLRPCFREVLPGIYEFWACVYRVTEGKVVKFCDGYTLFVGGGQ